MKFIYSGSFDPVTLGHEDIIRRASAMCGTLYVSILTNTLKKPYFTLEQRLEMLKLVCAGTGANNIEIVHFDGLLHELVAKEGIDAVVRGVRNYADFDYGMQSYPYFSYYNPGCETVLLPGKPEYLHISSTLVREHLLLGGSVEGLVSPAIRDFIAAVKSTEDK